MKSDTKYRKKTMNEKLKTAAVTIALVALLGGCTSQTTTEADFGNTVRDVIMNQTHDIGATLESEPEAVTGADPNQLENVINSHRERSAKSPQTGNP